jgi:aspartyl-tRNA(Asn)/glutamyl-tRNA(Gln) amidotransferase subunit C
MSVEAVSVEAVSVQAVSGQAVSVQDVRRVAELANLQLTAEEEPRMQRDLNAILEHIAQLNELDTKDVPPMAQVGEMVEAMAGSTAENTGAALRQDAVRPSIDRKAVMASAPESDGRFFKVPKVIER